MSTVQKYFLYTIVIVGGGAVLALEVLGTRIIAPFYGTTLFVWTSLILITLGALAIGYFLGGVIADRYPYQRTLYLFLITASILFLAPMKIDQWVLPATNQFGFQFGPLWASLLLFFLPLVFLGMLSPYVIRLLSAGTEHAGRTAGRVFALSTLGSIVGGFLTGFYFIQTFSLSDTLSWISLLLVVFGVSGWALSGGVTDRQSTSSRVALSLLVLAFFLMWIAPEYTYEDTYTLQVHHHEQSFYADLKVIEIGRFTCLAMNGSFQSCYNNVEKRPTFTYIAEVGRIVRERNIKNMLVLGLGSGNVLHDIPRDVVVDVVELDPQLVPIAKDFFDFDTDRVGMLALDDARHFLLQNTKRYDLVLVDIALGSMLPPHIFSTEGMALWSSAITDNGLVLINGEGKLGDEDMQLKTLMQTATRVFPHVVLTVTEPDRFTSVLVHLSKDTTYAFNGGGMFTAVPIDLKGAPVMTDNFNTFDIISLEKLKLFRDEMANVGGLRLLFSS